jgi:hypothetical protein
MQTMIVFAFYKAPKSLFSLFLTVFLIQVDASEMIRLFAFSFVTTFICFYGEMAYPSSSSDG